MSRIFSFFSHPTKKQLAKNRPRQTYILFKIVIFMFYFFSSQWEAPECAGARGWLRKHRFRLEITAANEQQDDYDRNGQANQPADDSVFDFSRTSIQL